MRFPAPPQRPRRAFAAITTGLAAAGFIAAGFPASSPAAAGSRPAASRPVALRPAASGRPRHIHARGAEVMNAVTGQRLWSRNLNRRKPMGSITKVMTALV